MKKIPDTVAFLKKTPLNINGVQCYELEPYHPEDSKAIFKYTKKTLADMTVIPNEIRNVTINQISTRGAYVPAYSCIYEVDNSGTKYYSIFRQESFFELIKAGHVTNGLLQGSFVFGRVPNFKALWPILVGSQQHKDLLMVDQALGKMKLPKKTILPNCLYLTKMGVRLVCFGKFKYPTKVWDGKSSGYIDKIATGYFSINEQFLDDFVNKKQLPGYALRITASLNLVENLGPSSVTIKDIQDVVSASPGSFWNSDAILKATPI